MKEKTPHEKAWDKIWPNKIEKQLKKARKAIDDARKMLAEMKKKRKKK